MIATPEYDKCCNIQMPFGKYIGQTLVTIPLRYLDETIAVMPPRCLVRQVIRLIDEVTNIHLDYVEPGPETAEQIYAAAWAFHCLVNQIGDGDHCPPSAHDPAKPLIKSPRTEDS